LPTSTCQRTLAPPPAAEEKAVPVAAPCTFLCSVQIKIGQEQKWSKTKMVKNKIGQNMFGQKYVRSKIIMVKNNNGQKGPNK
jgi:hypothetical protein